MRALLLISFCACLAAKASGQAQGDARKVQVLDTVLVNGRIPLIEGTVATSGDSSSTRKNFRKKGMCGPTRTSVASYRYQVDLMGLGVDDYLRSISAARFNLR